METGSSSRRRNNKINNESDGQLPRPPRPGQPSRLGQPSRDIGLRNRRLKFDGRDVEGCVEIVISKKEVEQFGLRKVRRKFYRFRQQQFSHFMRLSSSFRRYNGVKLLATLGCLLFIAGVVILSFTSSFKIIIPYNEKDTIVPFDVPRDVDGPFFVYAYITNFRTNFRRWIESKPHYYGAGSCGSYDTVDAALYIRPLETIPEISKYNRRDPLVPCGLTSFTYFNDEIEILAFTGCSTDQDTCPERSLTISQFVNSPKELFSLYARSTPEETEYYQWINPLLVSRFQTWLYSSFSKDFPVLIGTLRDYTLYRGKHELHLTKNVWPAKHFGSTKSILIMNLGSMGSSQIFLGLLSISWGIGLCLISLLFLWGVRRNIVFASNTLIGISPDELRAQWIAQAKEWVINDRKDPRQTKT